MPIRIKSDKRVTKIRLCRRLCNRNAACAPVIMHAVDGGFIMRRKSQLSTTACHDCRKLACIEDSRPQNGTQHKPPKPRKITVK